MLNKVLHSGIPHGALVVGGVHLIMDVTNLIWQSAVMYMIDNKGDSVCNLLQASVDGISCDVVGTGGKALVGFLIAITILDFSFALMLVIGSRKRNKCLMVPYMVWVLLLVSIALIATLVVCIQVLDAARGAVVFFTVLFFLLMPIFFVGVVIAQYIALKSAESEIYPLN